MGGNICNIYNQLKIDLDYIPTVRKQPDKIVQMGIFTLKGKPK